MRGVRIWFALSPHPESTAASPMMCSFFRHIMYSVSILLAALIVSWLQPTPSK